MYIINVKLFFVKRIAAEGAPGVGIESLPNCKQTGQDTSLTKKTTRPPRLTDTMIVIAIYFPACTLEIAYMFIFKN